jgi:hypothetical protein
MLAVGLAEFFARRKHWMAWSAFVPLALAVPVLIGLAAALLRKQET